MHIDIRFVPGPLVGRVSTRHHPDGRVDMDIDEAEADPDLLEPLRQEVRRLTRLTDRRANGSPIVHCHFEDDLQGVVEVETSPWLVSIYLRRGVATEDFADEFAAHLTSVLQHT